tara:strand:- start:254 stop:1093 length:840 start_codon:yes stop_codon:yes gene_type:complete
MVRKTETMMGNLLDDTVKVNDAYTYCPVQKCEQICDRHWSSKKVYESGEETDHQGVQDESVYEGLTKPASIIWAPSWVCNYNCHYCGLPRDTRKVLADEWVQGFSRFIEVNKFDGGLLHTNGGEPLFYEGIGKIFTYMASKNFQIGLTTNLSSDVWGKVVHAAPPEAWKSINCSIHPTEPKFSWEVYSGRILALQALGYPVGMNLVGHPSQIMLAPRYAKFCKDNGINFALIPMVGSFDGFNFKTIDDYPEKMRKIIKDLCPETLDDRNKFLKGARVTN